MTVLKTRVKFAAGKQKIDKNIWKQSNFKFLNTRSSVPPRIPKKFRNSYFQILTAHFAVLDYQDIYIYSDCCKCALLMQRDLLHQKHANVPRYQPIRWLCDNFLSWFIRCNKKMLNKLPSNVLNDVKCMSLGNNIIEKQLFMRLKLNKSRQFLSTLSIFLRSCFSALLA
jgi:hypothetical protein